MASFLRWVSGDRIQAVHLNQLIDAFTNVLGISDSAAAPPFPRSVNVRKYEANDTWVKPANLLWARVRVQAGGGGGGGAATAGSGEWTVGEGGGGGEYAESVIPAASLGSSEAVVVGAGGAAGSSSGGNGGNAGNSSFGSLVVANGGQGGGGDAVASSGLSGAPTGGSGGSGGTGDVVIPGSPGGGFIAYDANFRLVGAGGGSFMSNTPHNRPTAGSVSGVAGLNYGGGGGGAAVENDSGRAGGAGAAGVVIVEEWLS